MIFHYRKYLDCHSAIQNQNVTMLVSGFLSHTQCNGFPLSVDLSLPVFVNLSLFLFVSAFLSISVGVCMYVYLFVCLCVCLSLFVSVNVFLFLDESVFTVLCLFVGLSFSGYVFIIVCLSVWLHLFVCGHVALSMSRVFARLNLSSPAFVRSVNLLLLLFVSVRLCLSLLIFMSALLFTCP